MKVYNFIMNGSKSNLRCKVSTNHTKHDLSPVFSGGIWRWREQWRRHDPWNLLSGSHAHDPDVSPLYREENYVNKLDGLE